MTLLGQNGLVVCSLILASAFASKWVLDRVVPILVGGLILGASAVAAAVHGLWIAMTGDDSLDEAKEKLGEAIGQAEQRPYDGQRQGNGTGIAKVELEPDKMTPEEWREALRKLATS